MERDAWDGWGDATITHASDSVFTLDKDFFFHFHFFFKLK